MSSDGTEVGARRHRVAAVCAPQPNHNPGMQSVDLALVAFARRHPELDVRYYRVPVADPNELQGQVSYGDLIADWEEVLRSDRILYWGDFHQIRSYILELDQRRAAQRQNRDRAHGPTSRYLLLEDADVEVRRRAVGFGGTLLHNSSRDYADHTYHRALQALLTEGRAWWFRDPYSATQAASLAGDLERSFLGTDASLLLPADAPVLEEVAGEVASGGRLGVYLGRAYGSYGARYRFAVELAELLGVPVSWIPWMPDRGAVRSRRFRVRHPMVARRVSTDRRDLTTLLGEIASCSVIVTDTYHLAVNAWRSGVPAVCIGHDVSPLSVDVSSGPRFEWRDKRHVFYSMYGLQGLYVHERELMARGLRSARLEQLRSRLEDPTVDLQGFRSRVEVEREQFGRMLVEALTSE